MTELSRSFHSRHKPRFGEFLTNQEIGRVDRHGHVLAMGTLASIDGEDD